MLAFASTSTYRDRDCFPADHGDTAEGEIPTCWFNAGGADRDVKPMLIWLEGPRVFKTLRWREMDSNSLGGCGEPAKLRFFSPDPRVMVSRQKGARYHNSQASGGFAATSLPCFRPRNFFVDLVKLDLDLVGDFAKEQHGLLRLFESVLAGIADDDLS